MAPKKRPPKSPVPETQAEAMTRRRNERGQPERRFGATRRAPKVSTPALETYKAIVELLRIGQAGIDDARAAIEMVMSALAEIAALPPAQREMRYRELLKELAPAAGAGD